MWNKQFGDEILINGITISVVKTIEAKYDDHTACNSTKK